MRFPVFPFFLLGSRIFCHSVFPPEGDERMDAEEVVAPELDLILIIAWKGEIRKKNTNNIPLFIHVLFFFSVICLYFIHYCSRFIYVYIYIKQYIYTFFFFNNFLVPKVQRRKVGPLLCQGGGTPLRCLKWVHNSQLHMSHC